MSSWESDSKYKYRNKSENDQSHFVKFLKYFAGIVLIALTIYAGRLYMGYIAIQQIETIAKNSTQQLNANLQATLERQRRQAAIAESEKTHMERKWVEGKSAKECQNSKGFLDNKTVECMNGHYDYEVVKNSR